MKNINKIYFREMRDTLGRYANWPLHKSIGLGSIGTYHGRKCEFVWPTTLDELGIKVSTPDPQGILPGVLDELYSTSAGVDIKFNNHPQHNSSKATIKFRKNRSIVTQGYETVVQQLPIRAVEAKILEAIRDGLEWDMKWVIITEIWLAKGFSMLMSGSNQSTSEIATGSLLKNSTFNIADVNLGLHVHKSTQMEYQGIAKSDIRPFFQIHTLAINKTLKQPLYLKRYGRIG